MSGAPTILGVDAPRPDRDQPRRLGGAVPRADRIFHGVAGAAAGTSLIIICTTAFFLAWGARDALSKTGIWSFVSGSVWNASAGRFGVGGVLVGTVLIALVALLVAVPLGLGLALYVNEYAPPWLRRPLTSAVDLLAALPSLIFGMWGLFALQGPLVGFAQFFADHLSAVPFFRAEHGDALSKSGFIGGVVVGLMILPVVTSVTRDVMSQCPREQCEGALALGGSRWGMIRSVLLPFSRSGMVGAILLGFGRALGETIAVAILVAFQIEANTRVLTTGGGSISELIAVKFGEAKPLEMSALIAAGFALFLVTLVVNLGARTIVRRARSAS
jgi:phosphate transport system permease protein